MVARSKYNVSSDKTKRTFDGIVYDSVLECRFMKEVIMPGVGSGEILSYELQKKYELQPSFTKDGKKFLPIIYIADFVLNYADGHTEVIDVKGNVDSTFTLKKKMLLFHYPDINFRTISYSKIDGGWVDRDYIIKQRKMRKKQRG